MADTHALRGADRAGVLRRAGGRGRQRFALLEAAVSVAQDEHPQLDAQGVLAQIDALAERLKRRMPADAARAAAAAPAEPLLLPRAGLRRQRQRLLRPAQQLPARGAGDAARHPDHAGAAVHRAGRADRPAARAACPFPGHFLVKLRCRSGEVIIDPFSGHSLSREELDERLLPYRAQHGLAGDFDVPLGLFLQAGAGARRDRAAAAQPEGDPPQRRDWRARCWRCCERLVILLPQVWEERRDRGLVLAELGQRGRRGSRPGRVPEAPARRGRCDAAAQALRRLRSGARGRCSEAPARRLKSM